MLITALYLILSAWLEAWPPGVYQMLITAFVDLAIIFAVTNGGEEDEEGDNMALSADDLDED